MSRLALVVACATAHAEGWQGRAAIGNDAFTSVIPPLDDQGFTNDLALAILTSTTPPSVARSSIAC